jgi:hypothetical protein
MRDNINKVSERGERLDSLQDKTDNLQRSAQGFRRGANRVRKAMWWKDMKMRMCIIGVIVAIILIAIIVPRKLPSCSFLLKQITNNYAQLLPRNKPAYLYPTDVTIISCLTCSIYLSIPLTHRAGLIGYNDEDFGVGHMDKKLSLSRIMPVAFFVVDIL